MGLMDILNGMQNGPRGQTDPERQGRHVADHHGDPRAARLQGLPEVRRPARRRPHLHRAAFRIATPSTPIFRAAEWAPGSTIC